MTPPLDEAVETLSTLAGEADRGAFLAGRPDLVQAAVAERLVDAAREHLHVDRQRSLALAIAAETIAHRLGDDRLLGLCLRAQANALWASGASAAAVERHERALSLLESVGDEPEIARTLNASMQPLILLGRYDEAMRAAERARDIFGRIGDGLRLARLEINVGNIFHRQDRFDEALACYERAFERIHAIGDVEGTVSALHNKAVTLTTLTRFPEALATYRAARALCVAHAMPLAVVQTDYNVAWLYYLRGEYARAIDVLREAADAAHRAADRYHSALCTLDLSEIYLELGLNEDARELAGQARRMFDELGMGYEAAKALANSAIAYGREGNVARALTLFDRAQALFVCEANYAWPSLIDLYRAVLLFQEGRFAEARRLAEAAGAFFATTSLSTKTALCHLLQARIGLRRGELDGAQQSCERAMAQLAGLETPAITYETHLLLGHVQAARGHRTRAFASYEAARRDLETLRGRLRGDELKIAFGRNRLEVYENLVALCLEDRHPRRLEAAFGYVEQAKGRSLLDLIARPPLGPGDVESVESPGARRIRELREELNWLYHEIERHELRPAGGLDAKSARLQQEVGARERELARRLRELPPSEASQVDQYQSPTVTLDEIRQALPPHTVLLEYFEVQDRIVLWVVSRDGLRVVPLAPRAAMEDRVRRLQFQLGKFRLGAVYVRRFGPLLLESVRAHLRGLHRDLLGPIWRDVRGGHLLVVPHGVLHYVPFHALFDGRRHVIDRCTVSYAPSASIYARAHQQPAPGAEASLVLAVPDERAPLIETEAREVTAVLPRAVLYLGSEATCEVLRSRGPSSRVVHIASHGRFRPDNPMFSAVRLGDGYLNVYDLYKLSLPAAALVTLSGCATGQSIAAAGDEILGISRGLFCAGARSLLLTLWDVHDESTTEFMTAFYRALCATGEPAEAVRTAMRQAKARHPHPYYWAPFVLMGRFTAA